MIKISVNNEIKSFDEGVTFLDVVKSYLGKESENIYLCKVNTKTYELFKKVNFPDKDIVKIEFISNKEREANLTYKRTAIFILIKSLIDVFGKDKLKSVELKFTISYGYYLEPIGDINLNEENFLKIKKRMQEIINSCLPITKKKILTSDAVSKFKDYLSTDREKLLTYRLGDQVNIYSLDGYEDYYYGFMLPNTSYIKYYDLIKYQTGIVLMTTHLSQPCKVQEFTPNDTFFEIQSEAVKWGQKIGITCVGELNETIANGQYKELILSQEALQENLIGNLAERIIDTKKRIIFISGPSSSGKTTFSHRLASHLTSLGVKAYPIGVDNYYKSRDEYAIDENGKIDFEALDNLDLEYFNNELLNLLKGEEVFLRTYDFVSGKPGKSTKAFRLDDNAIMIIEGIHALNDKMSYSIKKGDKFKIYISPLTPLNIDSHNRISSTDYRLLRRIVRDNMIRNYSAKQTISQWDSVRQGEKKNIFPYQSDADAVFNSVLIYELPIIKIFAEPLLFGIHRDEEEYGEARRLLRFLSYFLPGSPEIVPQNSILREFIGGSVLDVM